MRLRMAYIMLAVSGSVLMPLCAHAESVFNAKVVSVQDGDSLVVSHDGVKERVILYGIDCPERAQEFGSEARQYTDDRCFRKDIKIEDHGKDSRGRTIGVIFLPDGTNLNQELVRQGLAWWSDKYAPNDAALKQLHLAARKAHKGLWSSEKPIPPWIFRNGEKSVQATIKPSVEQPQTQR